MPERWQFQVRLSGLANHGSIPLEVEYTSKDYNDYLGGVRERVMQELSREHGVTVRQWKMLIRLICVISCRSIWKIQLSME